MSDHYEMIIGDLKDELNALSVQLSDAIASYGRLANAYSEQTKKIKRVREVLFIDSDLMNDTDKLKELKIIIKSV